MIQQNISQKHSISQSEKLKSMLLGREKLLEFKLAYLNLDSDKNIEIYKNLPIDNFNIFVINFYDLEQDKFEVA